MATLSISRTYNTGVVLTEADLDNICDAAETFLNTTKINDDNIQTGGITGSSKLADGTVNAAKLASDAVTTVKILDSNVTTAKIADSNVTTAKIADSNVTTAKINDLAVTTAKINDLGVTTGKIAANAVTRAKIEAVGHQLSSSSGTYSNSSGSATNVTNLSVTITTSGRPVVIKMISDGSGNQTKINVVQNTGSGTPNYPAGVLIMKRDSTEIARTNYGSSFTDPGTASNVDVGNGMDHIDVPSAGTYTYVIQGAFTGTGTGSINVKYWKLIAYEL